MKKMIIICICNCILYSMFSTEIAEPEKTDDFSFIEYIYGKGLTKNGKKIFTNKEIKAAIAPVPEALKLFKKSHRSISLGYAFLGIGVGMGISYFVASNLVSNYLSENESARQNWHLYSFPIVLAGVASITSMIMFIILIASGYVLRRNSILRYNTEIYKRYQEKNIKPDISYSDDKLNFGIRFVI